jgi:hypothetical protein
VEFRILGAFEVISSDGSVTLGARREHIIPAMLLVEAGRIVSVERLIDAVWSMTLLPLPPSRHATPLVGSAKSWPSTMGESSDDDRLIIGIRINSPTAVEVQPRIAPPTAMRGVRRCCLRLPEVFTLLR